MDFSILLVDSFIHSAMPYPENCTVFILAGGKSSRMGTDKGLLLFRGKRLVDYVIGAAQTITSHILIITANPEYANGGITCLEDEMQGKGPLGGIYTGLIHTGSEKNLFLGCDMPFLTGRLLQELLKNSGEEEVLLSQHRGLAEPLCSVYDKRCAVQIRAMLDKNQLKITDALAGLKTRTISFDTEDWFYGNEFANINSPDELSSLET